MRLDQLLVARKLAETRSRARDAILRGTVRVNGKLVKKPSEAIPPNAKLEIDDPAARYVSRAALKLNHGLDHFKISPDGMNALDVGASTGGFTQVLLERGARHVTAVDVGHAQMAQAVVDNPRVLNIEGLNARNMTRDDIGDASIEFVVSDVSFISLKLAIPPALAFAEPGAYCLLLVKPQFEAGRDNVGKKGLLKDPEMGPEIASDLESWLVENQGWTSLGLTQSPIDGGDGNREYLLAGRKPN